MNTGTITSIVVNTDDFYNLREDWNYLLEKSESNTIFLRWEWLYIWWIVYGKKPDSLWIVVVRKENQIVGIAPTYLKRNILGFNQVSFLGSNEVGSDYLDLITLRGYEELAVSLIISFFQQNNRLWSSISLMDIPLGSKTLGVIRQVCGKKEYTIAEEHNFCPYISLQRRWEAVLDDFDPRIQNIINRKLRSLKKIGEINFIEGKSNYEMISYFSEFVALNKIRFGMMGIPSPFANLSFVNFHRKIISELCEYQVPRLFFLLLKDKPIAGLYLFNYNNRWLYYQAGFDPTWKNFSPGSLLLHHVLKCAFEAKVEEFDFLRGKEKYKTYWSKEKRINVKVKIYNKSAKGKLLKFIDQTTGGMKNLRAKVREQFFRREE